MDTNQPTNPNQTGTRIYRTESNRMLAGVCGGIARYLNVDVTLVRLFFVLFSLAGGSGLLLYIILAIVIPSDSTAAPGSIVAVSGTSSGQGGLLMGAGLLILGLFFLVQTTIGVWIPWLEFRTLWPLLLILAGGALLWSRAKGGLK